MDISSLSASSSLTSLTPIAVWAILFVVIWDTLKSESPFGGFASFVIAVAASLLAVIGMFGKISGAGAKQPNAPPEGGSSGFILLPYTAMGISILVVFLLLFLAKVFGFGRRVPSEDEKAGPAGEAGASRMREIEQAPRRDTKGESLTR